MSRRSEERSSEEDWRTTVQTKQERSAFLVRWGLLVAVLAVIAAINLIAWLSSR